MAGNSKGNKKTAATNIQRYGTDYYSALARKAYDNRAIKELSDALNHMGRTKSGPVDQLGWDYITTRIEAIEAGWK